MLVTNKLSALAVAISALFSALVLLVLWFVFAPAFPWESSAESTHTFQHILGPAIFNSLFLLMAVGLSTLLLGGYVGWVLSIYSGSSWFRGLGKLLILPMTIPAYLYAFLWRGYLEYGSPIEVFLREQLSWSIHSPGSGVHHFGLVLALSLALFPYVYLLSRMNFSRLKGPPEEILKVLGVGAFTRWRHFYWPQLWPAALAALFLVGIEVLVDYGAAATFNITTLSTSIYKTWIDLDSWQLASRLASLFLSLVFLILLVKGRWAREAVAVNAASAGSSRPMGWTWAMRLHGFALLLIFLVSFVWPMLTLVQWAWTAWDFKVLDYLLNTLYLGFLAAMFCLLLSVIRWLPLYQAKRASSFFWWLGGMGYSIPGTVLAVAFLSLLAFFQLSIDGVAVVIAIGFLLLAYALRFLAVSDRTLHSGSASVRGQSREVAVMYLTSWKSRWMYFYWPSLKGALGVAFLFVFVEVAKELPLTLMLRPLGWDTLAVRLYQFTAEGMYPEAATSALFIVLLGAVPVWFCLDLLQDRVLGKSDEGA